MLNQNASVTGNLIEMLQIHADAVGKIYGVESPGNQRLFGIIECVLDFYESLNHAIKGFYSRPQSPVGVSAIKKSNIGIFPDRTVHCMTMGFDKSWNQNFVSKYFIQRVITPIPKFIK